MIVEKKIFHITFQQNLNNGITLLFRIMKMNRTFDLELAHKVHF